VKLYLIRHAESESNVRNVLDTALPGPPLTALGQQQAQTLAAQLRDEPVVAVYASYATRAQQTARPLAAALAMDVQTIPGVHEVGVGALEGLGDRDSILTYLRTARSWLHGDLDLAMPGDGETGEQVRSRYLTAVGELRAKHEPADPAGVVALVSHGGAIRLSAEWLCDNVRPELADEQLLPNTGIVVLESLPAGGWTCLSWAGTPM
jgi:broad specificity phosphatase PhoE